MTVQEGGSPKVQRPSMCHGLLRCTHTHKHRGTITNRNAHRVSHEPRLSTMHWLSRRHSEVRKNNCIMYNRPVHWFAWEKFCYLGKQNVNTNDTDLQCDQLDKLSFINLPNICKLWIDLYVFIFPGVHYAKAKQYWYLPIVVCRKGRKFRVDHMIRTQITPDLQTLLSPQQLLPKALF